MVSHGIPSVRLFRKLEAEVALFTPIHMYRNVVVTAVFQVDVLIEPGPCADLSIGIDPCGPGHLDAVLEDAVPGIRAFNLLAGVLVRIHIGAGPWLDIEQDAQARKAYEALGGGGIPFVDVNGTLIRDYNPEAIMAALK